MPGYSFVHCLELGIDGSNELLYYYFVVNNHETPYLEWEDISVVVTIMVINCSSQ